MKHFRTHQIQTTIHGFYIIKEPVNKIPSPLLVGFHGYGEKSEAQMKMLQQIPGAQSWFCCSIQALHSFYNSKGKIGYCWMTSEDRELRIQENIDYVNSVISELKENYSINNTLVFHGFSQGTGIACRAAVLGDHQPAGVVLMGGDIPPELESLDRMQRILLPRGNKDRIYLKGKWLQDVSRIEQSNLDASFCNFDGGHAGNEKYYKAVGKFLKQF